MPQKAAFPPLTCREKVLQRVSSAGLAGAFRMQKHPSPEFSSETGGEYGLEIECVQIAGLRVPFKCPGFSGQDIVWGTPWLNEVPDGNMLIWKQIDSSFDRISLLLVLRDSPTLNSSAFPTSKWKSFVFLAEGGKDYAMRFQLELVFMHITFRFLQ